MKKILIVVMALALMATGAKADCAYQEFANYTAAGFSYPLNITAIFDGDWTTWTVADSGAIWHDAYANYTVPSGINNTVSAWQVKYGTLGFISNLSVGVCDWSDSIAKFKIESLEDDGASEQGTKWSCWNGTGWEILLYNSSTDEPPVIPRGTIYEEAMFWGDCGGASGPIFTTTTTVASTTSSTTSSTSTTAPTTTTTIATTIPTSTTTTPTSTTTIPTTISTTTTTIPMNISCHMCNITNIGPEMGLGALVWAPICGFLEILFCVPILFALALIGVTFIAAWLSIRRR